MLTLLHLREYIKFKVTDRRAAVNPYYMIGFIAISMVVYATLVAAVTLTGVSIGVGMIIVYAVMLGCMLSMQKRARQAYVPQAERRRSPVVTTAGFSAPIATSISLGRLAQQQAANQDNGVSAAAADAG